MDRQPATAASRAEAVAALSLTLAELTVDTATLEQEVVRRVADIVGDATALWRRDDEGHIQLAAFHHADPTVLAAMQELAVGATHSDTVGVLPTAWTLTEPLVLDAEALQAWRPLMQPAYQVYFSRYGMASLMVVPLRVRGTTVALLGASRDHPPGHDEDDQRFIAQVAAVVAVALDNDRLLRQVRQQLSEQNRAHLAAHRAALHDPLTGLPNRRLLLERLNAAASRAEGYVALLLVDLDGFKDINDSYGHATGDVVLAEVGVRLRRLVERHPACARATLARLGGDEFAVVVPLARAPLVSGDPPTLGEDLPAAVLSALAPPLGALGHEVGVRASVGVAEGRAREAAALLRRAGIAMYRAKRLGLGWTTWQQELDAAAEVRLREVARLRRALDTGELRVHYQPIVARPPRWDGRQEGTRHVEALVRWQHPERGLVPPADFLPLARQMSAMRDLTWVVIRQVVADLHTWVAAGVDVQASVNVGADDLVDPGFLPRLVGLLREADLPPAAVCLELTESELLAPEGPELLAAVRAAGMAVALDDFGTGYSSFAYLADLPLDRLKLDRSFVGRLGAHPRTDRLVRGLVGLVHELGHPVVAEGVETEDEARLLDGLGVEWQQGWLHGCPAPAADLGGWLGA